MKTGLRNAEQEKNTDAKRNKKEKKRKKKSRGSRDKAVPEIK